MRPSHPGRVSDTGDHGVAPGRFRALIVGVALLALLLTVLTSMMWFRASRATVAAAGFPSVTSVLPPPRGGYFRLLPVGTWSTLPSDSACAGRVHYSTWEPRPDNISPNQVMPDAAAVHRAFAARPLATDGNVDPRWDTWLLQRVDGQFAGTTDEIFQWVACKWGLPDDLLRAVAVRETGWYQYETYASGHPVRNWGSGDLIAVRYCRGIRLLQRDRQVRPRLPAGLWPEYLSGDLLNRGHQVLAGSPMGPDARQSMAPSWTGPANRRRSRSTISVRSFAGATRAGSSFLGTTATTQLATSGVVSELGTPATGTRLAQIPIFPALRTNSPASPGCNRDGDPFGLGATRRTAVRYPDGHSRRPIPAFPAVHSARTCW
jgi:hypothetical protein